MSNFAVRLFVLHILQLSGWVCWGRKVSSGVQLCKERRIKCHTNCIFTGFRFCVCQHYEILMIHFDNKNTTDLNFDLCVVCLTLNFVLFGLVIFMKLLNWRLCMFFIFILIFILILEYTLIIIVRVLVRSRALQSSVMFCSLEGVPWKGSYDEVQVD